MKRGIVYYGALPQDTDLLNAQKNAYIGLAKLAAAILGTTTIFHSLAATPGTGLTVSIGPGQVYSLQNLDNAAYGSVAADTAHQILKQGINLDSTVLNVPAPGTAGQSINYLIQAQFQEVDGGATVLPFYNSANPQVALSGPGNNGQASNTIRDNIVALQVKAGTAAATGSQTTPAADSGWTGLYVVTVAYGATSISQSNINTVAGAPFLTNQLYNFANGLVVGGMSTLQGRALINGAVDDGSTALIVAGAGKFSDAATTRTNMGLGSIATQAANAVAITGGTLDGVTIGGTTRAAVNGTTGNFNSTVTVANGTASGHAPNIGQIQANAVGYATDTGTATAYAIALSPALAAYAAGQSFTFKAVNANTGAATLNINTLGAKSIVRRDGSALIAGDIPAGAICEAVYDGTNFQLASVDARALKISNNLSDVSNAATARTNLGLGTIATQAASAVAVTGGTIDGVAIGGTTRGAVNGTTGNFNSTVTIANATATGHAAAAGQIQNNSLIYAVDTGVANAYAVVYTPAITALVDGMVLDFNAKIANTGASTLAVNGLTATSIVGASHQALQGGEIIANSKCLVIYSSQLSAFILLESTGGAVPVSAGTQSNHAVNLGQFANSKATSGYQKLPNGLIIQWGVNTNGTSGSIPVTFPIAFPNGILCPMASYNGTATGITTSVSNPTVNGMTVTTNSSTANTCYWYAIGY